MTVKSYNGYVPYLFLASSLATWLRIRILLVIIIIFILVEIALSAVTMQYDSGGFNKIDYTYNNWDSSVCNKAPTTYLQPFSFTFSSKNTTTGVTIASTSAATCPFPLANSAFRLTALCTGFAILGGLFFQSPMSYFARTILLCWSLFFFSCFVLDTNQTIIGFAACHTNFLGTNLGSTIVRKNVNILCSTSNQTAVVMFDFFLSLLLYLTFECWGMCGDLYGEKQERVSVIMTKNRTSVDVENPLHSRSKKVIVRDNTDYAPYEPNQHDYTPYESQGHDYTPYDSSTSRYATTSDTTPQKPPKSSVTPFVPFRSSANDMPSRKPPTPAKVNYYYRLPAF